MCRDGRSRLQFRQRFPDRTRKKKEPGSGDRNDLPLVPRSNDRTNSANHSGNFNLLYGMIRPPCRMFVIKIATNKWENQIFYFLEAQRVAGVREKWNSFASDIDI